MSSQPTKIERGFDDAIAWLRRAILVLILVTLTVILLRAFGVSVSIRTLGHVELAYLAGAYFLTK